MVHNLIFFVGIKKVIKWNKDKPLEVPLEVFQTLRPPFHIVFQAQNLGQARKGPQKLVFFTETLFFFVLEKDPRGSKVLERCNL